MARGRGGRGRGGQGNRGRGKRNKGPGKSRKKRVSRKPKNRVSRKPRSISKSTRKKISSDRKKKRLSKITNKSLKSRIKAAGLTKKTETKKKTISASQSRKQVRQNTKDKISTRKKINAPTAGQIGRTLRNIRQPMSGLSSMAINSVLGRPGIASTIAQAAVNNLGKQNRRTRDMSKISPQQQRKYQRLSERTGRDYSIRNPTFRLNMNMKDIAKFAGLDQNRFYNKLPRSIREAQVNKQFYGNPMQKGWHSSQRTGRGQGLTPEASTRQQLAGLRADPSQDIGMMYQNILGREADQEGLDYWTNEFRSGRQNMDDIRRQLVESDEFGGRSAADRTSVHNRLEERVREKQRRDKQSKYTDRVALPFFPPGSQPGYGGGGDGGLKIGLPYFPDGAPKPDRGGPARGLLPLPPHNIGGRSFRKPRPSGPQQDWLGSLYSRHNISGGKLDQEARDYWSNEAKTKGRKATARSIIGTAKASGTYGGRKRPRRIDTGRTPRAVPLPWFGRGPKTGKPRKGKGRRGLLSAAAGLAGGLALRGG